MDIYQRYGPALMRKCVRMLASVQDAEDIVQGLFVDLLKTGKTDVDLPYLYRASTNRCLNAIRNRKKRYGLLAERGAGLAQVNRIQLDEQAIGRDLVARLIDSLDRKSNEILVYRYFDDMTQDEIAGVTGYSRKTVGKRLKKLQQQARALAAMENGGTQ
ncbi:MAG: sigma-70 family RNA polymerase sigma factor [Myxococcota bacterium]|nr:sigma-70 family RNA polymerase sigma factor [Myxococcota bacterium]